jgi:hypothetical protein
MAYRRLSFVFVLGLAVVFTSCNDDSSQTAKSDPIKVMADLHCEAVSLRKSRFELADKMRFMEDTLMQPTTSDTAKALLQRKLDNLEPYKDSVVNGSLALAKVIKFKLDSLIENELTEPKERQAFDAELMQELERRGCQ